MIERLLSETIPGQYQAFSFSVMKSQGEHPSQVMDEFVSVNPVQVRDDFDVTLGTKNTPLLLKSGPKFQMVVDLSVDDDPDRSALV